MGILDYFANDPGSQQGGLFGTMGPLSGSQKAALLFSGLRDALADYQGRPANNMDALTQQFRADQMRRGYQSALSTLSTPSQPNEVTVTPQITDPSQLPQRVAAGAYNQPAMSQAGPLAGSPMADLLKSMPAEQGLPSLISMMQPHGVQTVTDASGVPHILDKLTGRDLGSIGGPKAIAVSPGQSLVMPGQGDGQSQPLTLPRLASALTQQESGGNPNIGTSVDGAVGASQILPSTFAQYAKPGENINNPADNQAVQGRILTDYAQRFGGDPARIATAYFSGPNNVAPAGSATPWIKDTKDGNGKSVSSYVSDVMGRLQPQQQNSYRTVFQAPPEWRTITDPAEAKSLNVNVGSQINTATNEVKPLSAYNMPASAEDPSVKMYGAILATTGHLPTGAGRDASSMRAYRTAAYNYLKAQGLSDEQIAQKIPANAIGYKAQGAAANTMAKTNAATAVNEGTVNNSINIVRTLLPFAASKGSFTDVNSFMQALGRKTNDPNAVMLKNGIDSISAEYARVMTGATGGTASSDASRKEAADRILTGYNDGTLNAVMNQMQLEMAGRSGSQNSVLKNLSNGSYGGVPVPYSPKKPPSMLPTNPANLPRKGSPNIIKYDAQGNRIQ